MNRSLMVIFVMGVIAMVMLTMFGSFFVGKVGGAENVASLRRDLQKAYGNQMEDPESLTVTVVAVEKTPGLLVAYPADPALAKNPKAMDYWMAKLAAFVLGDKHWRSRLAWVDLRVAAPGGKVVERRFVNKLFKAPA